MLGGSGKSTLTKIDSIYDEVFDQDGITLYDLSNGKNPKGCTQIV